jgi:hypothetical protein
MNRNKGTTSERIGVPPEQARELAEPLNQAKLFNAT